MSDKYFGLSEYAYNLIIDWFKSKDCIKAVRIFGSRSRCGTRFASDVDFLIEGNFSLDYLLEIKQELNTLRHPYRIDLVSVSSQEWIDVDLVQRNYSASKLFYLRSDFFPNEMYKEITINNLRDWENYPRWVYRYRNYIELKLEDFLNDFQLMLDYHENNYDDINMQISLFERFKNIYEGCWKIIKDYAKSTNNKKIFLPREIFKYAYENKIISNKEVWFDMIHDFIIMTDCPFNQINDEMIFRLKERYIPAMFEIRDYFEGMFLEVTKTN